MGRKFNNLSGKFCIAIPAPGYQSNRKASHKPRRSSFDRVDILKHKVELILLLS
jgi:hypothetical protein